MARDMAEEAASALSRVGLPGVVSVYLFGSHAEERAHRESDVDLGVLPSLIRRAETLAGRRLILFVRITDRPGGLARLLNVISEAKANVIEVEHVREGVDLILDGGELPGVPSTVVSLVDHEETGLVEVLREGAIMAADVEARLR